MRIQRAFLLEYDDHWKKIVKNKTMWDKVKIDIKDTIMAHSLKLGGVDPNMGVTKEYYNKKWGRYPATLEDPYNCFFYPFDKKENGLGYFTDDYYNEWIEKESKKNKKIFFEVEIACNCGNVFKSTSVSGNARVRICAACDTSKFMQDGTK